MSTNEELYEGFPRGQAYRQEAAEKYGAQVIEESEDKLRQLGKSGIDQLKAEQQDITQTLVGLVQLDPASAQVQQQIARHYANIRSFWGDSVCQSKNMAEAYKGLAKLYLDDPRFTSQQGEANPVFAHFLSKAMLYFADTQFNE